MFLRDVEVVKKLNYLLFVAILISVLVVMLDSISSIHYAFSSQLKIAEICFTILFSVEYIVRLIVAEKSFNYVISFLGIIDLISVLPMYINFFWLGLPPLFVLKILRLLRIFRILKLIQFYSEAEALGEALKKSFHKITVFLTVVFMVVLIIGSLMYIIENSEEGFTSIPQSIYWTIVTITTVGYGDIAPQTALGKLLASILMLIGYAIIAVPTGIVTADLSNAKTAPKSLKTCHNCLHSDHDLDAKYCKYCSQALSLNQSNPHSAKQGTLS